MQNNSDMMCIEVGFGDMVPSKSFLGYEESLFGKFQVKYQIVGQREEMNSEKVFFSPEISDLEVVKYVTVFTDAGMRHLLCHGSCSLGNVHVSHTG